MRSRIAILVFLVFVVFHQDVWNWDNRTLWLGFIPAGLGYHCVYSLAAGFFWYLVTKFAWPHKTEAWAELKPEE
ncbi:MAG: hypothetical protein KA250_03035 [Verrucomicrobiales bacterium]|jgi:hypothetical protein|nr:hypothetical protein [Verrucomicrobiales bacterium]MBP9224130.1 hypothetical protein [Verrucomicrobiales bacterium]HQZ27995.1 hypothetical protein [Verrucomicrobiales bacterium]